MAIGILEFLQASKMNKTRFFTFVQDDDSNELHFLKSRRGSAKMNRDEGSKSQNKTLTWFDSV
jgi:hypothetical protein